MATNEVATKSTMVNPSSKSTENAPTEKKRLPPPKKGNSKRKSEVWGHFTQLENGDPKKPRAVCNYCGITYACDPKINCTCNMLAHIQDQCKKYPYSKEDLKQKTLGSQTKKGEEGESGSNLVAVGYNYEACRKALAEIIIIDELPFKFVKGIGFRRFIGVSCPRFTNIPCRTTVAKRLPKIICGGKEKVKKIIER